MSRQLGFCLGRASERKTLSYCRERCKSEDLGRIQYQYEQSPKHHLGSSSVKEYDADGHPGRV